MIDKLGTVRLGFLAMAAAGLLLLLLPVSATALGITISTPLLPPVSISLPAPGATNTQPAPVISGPVNVSLSPSAGSLVNDVNNVVNTLPLPQPSSDGLPTIPAYDPNSTLQQTDQIVNDISPIAVPSSSLPTIPLSTPSIDPNRVLDPILDPVVSDLNKVISPLSLPNPVSLLYPPLSGLLSPTPISGLLPGLPAYNAYDNPLDTQPLGLASPAGMLGQSNDQRQGIVGPVSQGRGPGDPPNGGGGGDDYRVSAMSPSDGGLLQAAAKGLYVLPLLGLACIALAIVSYLRSSRSIWAARRA